MGWIDRLCSLPLCRQVVYVLALIGAAVLLVWDIVDKEAQYTTVAFFVLIAICVVALRAPNRSSPLA
jgi:predicted membrane channel-forming protein YqfA (hemolysin III family)